MKKLLLLFAVLLGTVGAWAQTDVIQVSTSTAKPEHIYYIMCNNSYGGNKYYMNKFSAPASTKECAHKFAFFAGTKEGDYKIYSVDENCWLSYTPSNADNKPGFAELETVQEESQVWKASLAKEGAVYQFQPYNTEGSTYNSYMNWNGGVKPAQWYHYELDGNETVGVWRQGANDDAGSAWVVEEVLPEVTFTYSIKYNGTERLTQSVTARVGMAYPQPIVPDYVTYTLPEGNVASSDNGKEIEIVCVANLPFEVSADYASATWYNMTIRSNAEAPVAYSSKVPYPHSVVAATDRALWAFVGNPFDGIKVLNKANEGKFLGVDANSNAVMQEEEHIWVLQKGNGGFLLLQELNTNKYVHDLNSSLRIWDNGSAKGDPGSALKVYAPEEYASNLPMQVGSYYRIQSTTRETYTGINGYTSDMQNQDLDENNPGQIWKLIEDGCFYLQNVYAGLYPQHVPDGDSNTIKLGTSKDYYVSTAKYADPAEGSTDAQWNIFFGGRQVNIEENGNLDMWWGDNAHHYIYEVEATDAELDEMCMNWYNANKYTAPEATADTYQKIDIDANATVIISPSEFAAPSVINEAIDNLAAVEGDLNVTVENVSDIHTLFAALVVYAPAKSALTAYKNAVTAHGELLSIAYTPKAEWGTIILPINWAKPEGWTRYSCAATEGNVLTLTEFPNGGTTKNSPMIIQVEEDKIGTTYQLIGYSNGAGTENVKSGLLTGVLEDNTIVPDGSYVLARQKSTGKIGFFPVAEGANYGLEKYKCYLTLAPASSRYNALFFDGTETAIESVEGEDENAKAVVYDLAGRRVQNAQKGVFIVNGKVVIK